MHDQVGLFKMHMPDLQLFDVKQQPVLQAHAYRTARAEPQMMVSTGIHAMGLLRQLPNDISSSGLHFEQPDLLYNLPHRPCCQQQQLMKFDAQIPIMYCIITTVAIASDKHLCSQ